MAEKTLQSAAEIKLFQFSDDRCGELEATVEDLIPLQAVQIGKSFSGKLVYPDEREPKSVFLKLPLEEALLGSSKIVSRMKEEASRGQELNSIDDALSDSCKDDDTFSLPEFIDYGEITLWYEDGSCRRSPCLVYDLIPGESLATIQDRNYLCQEVPDVLSWCKFAEGLANCVRRLHNHEFLHGQIVPRNILKDDTTRRFALAGFGYSSLCISESRIPDADSDAIDGDRNFLAPEYRVDKSLDALWHPTDIFSIGAVLLFVATGRIPDFYTANKFKFRNNDELKAYVRKELEQKRVDGTPGFLHQNHNVAKIIDNCVRFDPDHRFEMIEDLFESLYLIQSKDRTRPEPVSELRQQLFHSVSERKTEGGTEETFPGFSRPLIEKDLHEIYRKAEGIIHRKHFPLRRRRTEWINDLCMLLQSISPGGVYRTLTLPSYWTEHNLGPNGQFLSMNKWAAQNGVKIQRLFYVRGNFHTLSDKQQEILRNQLEASTGLENMNVKVRVVKESDIFNFERAGHSVAFLSRKDGPVPPEREPDQYACLNFISRGTILTRYGKTVIDRDIRKVRVWDPYRADVYWKKLIQESNTFDNMWRDHQSLDLADYIDSSSALSLSSLLAKDHEHISLN